MTKEDYIDDVEEETAQLLIDKKFNELDDPMNTRGHDFEQINKNEDNDTSLSQQELLEDEDGNLYFEDAEGNLVPYELPADELIETQM